MAIQPHSHAIESDFKTLKALNKLSAMETCIREIYKTWILKDGCVAIDIGAHKGLHTFPMADKVGKSGRVFAFEANPTLAIALTQSVISLPQVSVINAAVSDETMTSVTLYINDNHLGQSTIVQGFGNNFTAEHAVNVPCISIDAFLHSFLANKHFAFVKIDAEGAELDILRGMRNILTIKSPLICAEISLYHWITHIDIFNEFLDSIDYAAFTLSGIELTSLSSSLIKSLASPAYTLIFCKRTHWTHDFAANPDKMTRLVRRVLDTTLSAS